jgi:isopentenyl-diphosphate delta-isomerase
MNDQRPIVRRKDEHLDVVLRQGAAAGANPFDAIALEHCALPEVAMDEVDLSTRFLGRALSLPFVISSMTGGSTRGAEINRNLALAAEHLGIVLAVGSQRVALEGEGTCGIDSRLRLHAPTIPIWANFGGAQLVKGYGVDEARRAMEMIGADAMIIHLNPLQEAVQGGGDRDWRGVLEAIDRLARELEAPVIVKEIGFGVSAGVARWLQGAGVAAVDVAGAGGTDWVRIEAERAGEDFDREIADAFSGWGTPTPVALAEVRAACPDLPLVGSGGVRNGVDAAKAIRLGADLVAQAGMVLPAALSSAEAVVDHFERMARQLRIACFCTGSRDLAALKTARLTANAVPVHDF